MSGGPRAPGLYDPPVTTELASTTVMEPAEVVAAQPLAELTRPRRKRPRGGVVHCAAQAGLVHESDVRA